MVTIDLMLTSLQAHTSVERAGLLNLLPVRCLPVNDKFELTGENLEAAILKDISEGKIPFYVSLDTVFFKYLSPNYSSI